VNLIVHKSIFRVYSVASMNDKLSPNVKERYNTFAREYVLDFNATRAASATGYSEATAHVQGARLLKHAKVQQIIAKLVEKRAEKLDLSADKVLNELKLLGFSNMLDYIRITDGEAYIDLSNLTRDQAAAIGEITSEVYVDHYEGTGADKHPINVKRTKFKLVDKTKNLELLGRYLKLFHEDRSPAVQINLTLNETDRRDAIAIAGKLMEA
jgi:phage terminase small subunit